MAYPIEKKLVVAVSGTALFDLKEESEVFATQGVEAFREYQLGRISQPLKPGQAFPFIRRLLKINEVYKSARPVEVVLMSRNSPETGQRVFASIQQHGLDITRAAFTSGLDPCRYMSAFNVSLFLSLERQQVEDAIKAGQPAGVILPGEVEDDPSDSELRVAFDFDGVVADDSAERVYQESDNLSLYHQHEVAKRNDPLPAGPLQDFFKKLAFFQKLEQKRCSEDPSARRVLRTAIVTARNAPAHDRAINTLKHWNVDVDEMLLLGGIEKARVLKVLRPHLFLDDQMGHLKGDLTGTALVHVPFGVAGIAPS